MVTKGHKITNLRLILEMCTMKRDVVQKDGDC